MSDETTEIAKLQAQVPSMAFLERMADCAVSDLNTQHAALEGFKELGQECPRKYVDKARALVVEIEAMIELRQQQEDAHDQTKAG